MTIDMISSRVLKLMDLGFMFSSLKSGFGYHPDKLANLPLFNRGPQLATVLSRGRQRSDCCLLIGTDG